MTKKLVLVDDLAVREVDGLDIAGNAGANIDRVDGFEATDIFIPFGNRLPDRLGDGYAWRGGRGHLCFSIVAGREA